VEIDLVLPKIARGFLRIPCEDHTDSIRCRDVQPEELPRLVRCPENLRRALGRETSGQVTGF
jgi:hypothetical protein